MKKKVLLPVLFAYAAVLLAAVVRMPADVDCKTQIKAGPNGTILFVCPEVVCDDLSSCKKDDTVIVEHPDIGKSRQHYCRCGDYSPNLKCLGLGYINVKTAVWTYECMRNGCAVPCTEFNWPPVAAPQFVCDC
jgi:hypothetical protein